MVALIQSHELKVAPNTEILFHKHKQLHNVQYADAYVFWGCWL